jgi:predicted nucleotidyltransferase component of viral defense system
VNGTEELLVRLLNHLAEKLKDRMILKGGMLLRLLESPRPTQDLDFVFVSKESRKVLVKEIVAAIEEIEGMQVTRQDLNSRGIFIDVREEAGKNKATLEIDVAPAPHLPPEPISTARLSSRYSLAGHVVSAMALPEAFAHKIAACLERGVTRDLYDLFLLEPMTSFDEGTLRARLDRLEIDRSKPRKVSAQEASELLKKRLDDLTEERLREELYPLLPAENRMGLLTLIRAAVSRIIQRLTVS